MADTDTKHPNYGRLPTLTNMQIAVRKVNEANGWFDEDRTFGDGIALLHSELSEALEAYRQWGMEDVTLAECALPIGQHKPNDPRYDPDHHCKPEGVGSEFADVLVRLLDECDRQGIDLEDEFWRKLRYNKTRGYKHGGKGL